MRERRTYLLVAEAFVRVVQLVGEDLSVAGEGLVPGQRDRGGRARHRLQVGRRAGHLDWWHRQSRRRKTSEPDPCSNPNPSSPWRNFVNDSSQLQSYNCSQIPFWASWKARARASLFGSRSV